MGNLYCVDSRAAAMTQPDRRHCWPAFLWMAGTSVLFIVVYGGCNWITSQRPDVGTWYYAWENHIPFVPAMIIPYWSLDLFFVGSFFLCRNRSELATLGKRVILAIVVAGICFLLLPLRLGFPRPQVSGVFGDLYDMLRAFDSPYNLVPSLHITLRTILVETWSRHTRGIARGAVHIWFSLIGLSTVFTYQHQVVDVVGGFLLAIVCFYTFREADLPLPAASNRRVSFYYGVGAVAAVLFAATFYPVGMVFLWPAMSLGIMALAYCGWGARVFRKEAGCLPLSSRLVLAPCLLGHRLSLLYYSRRCRSWDEVVPGVLIGRWLTASEAAAAVRDGVRAVLDLTAEFSEPAPFRNVAYRNVPLLDLTAPTLKQLTEAATFIEEHAARGRVYVHCKIGYSRSAAAVGAYLLQAGKVATVEEAVAIVRKARPSLVVRPEVFAALRAFQQTVPL